MIRFLLLIAFAFSLSNASGTYGGFLFNDYEENASLYLVNYYPKQHFVDIGFSTTYAQNLIAYRPYSSLSQLGGLGGYQAAYFGYLRSDSHLIDWNVYTDQFGMTLHQTNFLYGLTGLLVGFGFMIGFIIVISRIK